MANPLREAALRSMKPHAAPKATSFSGAHHSRLTEDWIFASIRSADAEVKGDLRTLRKRSREMVRNSSLAARFQALVSDNVIGPHGIRFQSRPLDELGEYDREAAKKVEEAWERWASEPLACTADGRLAWHDVEDLMVQTQAQDGEAFLRLLPGFRNEFGFAVQMLDADQLDEDYNRVADKSGNEIRMGVEIDRWGRPTGYHIWTSHPFDYQAAHRRERIRIPADQMIHRYQVRRPGQTRGTPWYAPVLMDARMLAALQEAELVASRISAMKSGVFEQDDTAVLDPDNPEGGAGDFEWTLEHGVFETLPPGLKAKFFDPTHPNSAFEGFSKIILRSIAAGLGTSYHSLTGDLTDVNFSSIRQGTLQERDVWRRIQAREASHTHRRVFLAWLRWALTMGVIDLSIRERERLSRHEWVPRGWPWVDPTKDAQAAALQIRLGLDSRTRLAAEQGRDFEEVVETIAREERQARELGVELSTSTAKPPARDTNSEARIAPPYPNGNGAHRLAGYVNNGGHE